MRKFGIVLKYELKEYVSNKAFMILTVLLALAGAVLLFLPRFVDLSDFTGVQTVDREETDEGEQDVDEGERDIYLYLDEAGILRENVLTEFFPGVEWRAAGSREELIAAVGREEENTATQEGAAEDEAQAGFIITGETEYEYYVYNKSMTDSNTAMFDEVMRQLYRLNYSDRQGWNLDEIDAMYHIPITVSEQVLNKDTGENFWYCYVLVILVFMLIVMYGQMIAVAVTNEKSNRAIEVLVTSTTPNSLLFGKVVAGAIGGLFQAGLVLGAVLLSYQANREVWGGQLDMFLHVPADVLITFAVFGLGGYLFYAFLYGAMGALVSKTEDVSKSASGLMVIVMVVYFFSLLQLDNVEGPIIKVLSFLPVSSYSTMFARIAMGTVAPWEILLSFVILVASIFGAGVLGAKIYRMGTLRYGNPIKIGAALKEIRKETRNGKAQ